MAQLTHPRPQVPHIRLSLRWLAAAALFTAAGIALFFAISAGDEATQTPNTAVPDTAVGIRFDGGPEEGTRGVVPSRQPAVRYDGGPEEGTAALTQRSAPATLDPNSIKSPPGARYDGGPEEGTRGIVPAQQQGIRYDGGPEEGTRGIVPAQQPGIRYDGGPEEGSRGSGR